MSKKLASRFRGSKSMSIALALSGFAALAITILMNRHAGAAMGATDEGRMLLSAAAIAVDVVGICVFGMAAGALLASRGGWMKSLGVVFLVVMLGSVGFSIMSIMNFVGAERLSVDQAIREKAEERQRKTVAAEAALKERGRIANETAEKAAATQRQLAEQHLKWLQGQSRRDDLSRKERKEILTGAGDVIAKVGQVPAPQTVEQAAPEVEQDLLVRTEKGAEMIAEFSGLKARAVIALQMGWVAILLIVYKALAFPGAALLWPRETALGFVDVTPERGASHQSAGAPALAAATNPLALTAAGSASGSPLGAALLSQPSQASEPSVTERENAPLAAVGGSGKEEPYATDKRPVNPFLGRPLPGSESELRSIGFPIDGRPPGGLRPKLSVKDEALQFVTALRAYGMADIAIYQQDMPRLYRAYAMANHREQVAEAALLDVMQRMRSAPVRVEYGKMRYDESKKDHKRLSYKITGKTFPKTAPPGGGVEEKRPFTPSTVVESDPAPVTAKPRLVVVPTRSFQPDGERWSLHDQVAEARRLKAEQRGQSRQMRRTQHRWAA